MNAHRHLPERQGNSRALKQRRSGAVMVELNTCIRCGQVIELVPEQPNVQAYWRIVR